MTLLGYYCQRIEAIIFLKYPSTYRCSQTTNESLIFPVSIHRHLCHIRYFNQHYILQYNQILCCSEILQHHSTRLNEECLFSPFFSRPRLRRSFCATKAHRKSPRKPPATQDRTTRPRILNPNTLSSTEVPQGLSQDWQCKVLLRRSSYSIEGHLERHIISRIGKASTKKMFNLRFSENNGPSWRCHVFPMFSFK